MSIVRRLLAPLSALILILAAAGTVMAWSNPDLESACAPDADHYAWSILLPTEDNYNMEFSWAADFGTKWDGRPVTASPFSRRRDRPYVGAPRPRGGDKRSRNAELCQQTLHRPLRVPPRCLCECSAMPPRVPPRMRKDSLGGTGSLGVTAQQRSAHPVPRARWRHGFVCWLRLPSDRWHTHAKAARP